MSPSPLVLLDDIAVFCLGEAKDVLESCDGRLRRTPIVFPLALTWLYVAHKALVARRLITSACAAQQAFQEGCASRPAGSQASEAGS